MSFDPTITWLNIPCPPLVNDHRPNALARVHQLEALVDVLELKRVGDHRVDRDLPVHVPVDDLGTVGPALGAAERRAAPVAAGDQLERTRRDFLPRLGDPDDDARSPAAVAAFERGTHDLRVAGRVERIVGAAVRYPQHFIDDRLAVLAAAVDEIGHPELAAPFLAVGVDVDADDLVRADHPGTLDNIESDPAEAEHHDVGARL